VRVDKVTRIQPEKVRDRVEPITTNTVVSAVGTAVKGYEHGVKAWSCLAKRFWGEVEITEPVHNAVWTREWLSVKGTHAGKKRGHYWLMTANVSKYWPQGEINFQHDGTWFAEVNLGLRPGPKNGVILVVWVDVTVHQLLQDIKRRNKFVHKLVQDHSLGANLVPDCWSPFELNGHSGRSFSVVTYRTIQFPPGPIKT
jgi:hypothetical protein